MSYTGLLNQTCTIKRRTAGSTEAATGQVTYGAYAVLSSAVPARIDESEAVEVERDKKTHVSTHRAFFTAGESITEDDILIDADSNQYDVLSVISIRGGKGVHHQEATLRIVT